MGEDGRVVTSREDESGVGVRRGAPGGQVRTHKLWAATVEAIAIQVTVPIAGHENATQLPITSCVECVI